MEALQPQFYTVPRLLFWVLILAFVSLQVRLWVGEGGVVDIISLKTEVERQQRENRLGQQRNERLRAEVDSLKHGLAALEERARNQLGMIKDNETFFLIIDPKSQQ